MSDFMTTAILFTGRVSSVSQVSDSAWRKIIGELSGIYCGFNSKTKDLCTCTVICEDGERLDCVSDRSCAENTIVTGISCRSLNGSLTGVILPDEILSLSMLPDFNIENFTEYEAYRFNEDYYYNRYADSRCLTLLESVAGYKDFKESLMSGGRIITATVNSCSRKTDMKYCWAELKFAGLGGLDSEGYFTAAGYIDYEVTNTSALACYLYIGGDRAVHILPFAPVFSSLILTFDEAQMSVLTKYMQSLYFLLLGKMLYITGKNMFVEGTHVRVMVTDSQMTTRANGNHTYRARALSVSPPINCENPAFYRNRDLSLYIPYAVAGSIYDVNIHKTRNGYYLFNIKITPASPETAGFTVLHCEKDTLNSVAPSDSGNAAVGTKLSVQRYIKKLGDYSFDSTSNDSFTITKDGENSATIFYVKNIEIPADAADDVPQNESDANKDESPSSSMAFTLLTLRDSEKLEYSAIYGKRANTLSEELRRNNINSLHLDVLESISYYKYLTNQFIFRLLCDGVLPFDTDMLSNELKAGIEALREGGTNRDVEISEEYAGRRYGITRRLRLRDDTTRKFIDISKITDKLFGTGCVDTRRFVTPNSNEKAKTLIYGVTDLGSKFLRALERSGLRADPFTSLRSAATVKKRLSANQLYFTYLCGLRPDFTVSREESQMDQVTTLNDPLREETEAVRTDFILTVRNSSDETKKAVIYGESIRNTAGLTARFEQVGIADKLPRMIRVINAKASTNNCPTCLTVICVSFSHMTEIAEMALKELLMLEESTPLAKNFRLFFTYDLLLTDDIHDTHFEFDRDGMLSLVNNLTDYLSSMI